MKIKNQEPTKREYLSCKIYVQEGDFGKDDSESRRSQASNSMMAAVPFIYTTTKLGLQVKAYKNAFEIKKTGMFASEKRKQVCYSSGLTKKTSKKKKSRCVIPAV